MRSVTDRRDNTSRLVSLLAKQVKEKKGAVSISIDELAGLAGIEGSQAKMILEKLSSVRILTLGADDHVTIVNQEQVDRLLRYLEMREIFGEMV